MSFLYKALLKDQQSKDSDQQVGNSGQQFADYADQAQYDNGSYAQAFNDNQKFWLVVVTLIAVVGVLAGYILASQKAENELLLIAETHAQEQKVKQQQIDELRQAEQQRVIEKLKLEQQVLQQQLVEQKAETEKLLAQKQVEPLVTVQVDEQGQVQTQLAEQSLVDTQSFNNPAEQLDEAEQQQLLEQQLAELPEELKQRFAQAVQATESEDQDIAEEPAVSSSSSLVSIGELSDFEQLLMPEVSYQMHIYASEPQERWIKVNDQTLTEGQWLTSRLKLTEIRQNEVIWQLDGRKFKQAAMQDYLK